MPEVFYTVFETWTDKDGNAAVQGFRFEEQEGQKPAANRAEAHYYYILSTAAVSDDLYHGAMIVRSDGYYYKPFEVYDRRPVPDADGQEA